MVFISGPLPLPSPICCHTYLSWVGPLYALNRKGLGPGAWVGLLGHPLPMCAKGADARWSGLVHAHGRAAHPRGCHASCHAGRVHAAPHGGRPPRPGLVHELAVIRLGGTHLERGTHLQREKKKKKKNKMPHALKVQGGKVRELRGKGHFPKWLQQGTGMSPGLTVALCRSLGKVQLGFG